MPFKEAAFSEELTGALSEADAGLVQTMFLNQGPIIRLWAVVMLINLLMILFIL